MRHDKLPVPLARLVDDAPPARSREMWRVIEQERMQRGVTGQGRRGKRVLQLGLAACLGVLVALGLSHSDLRTERAGMLADRNQRALPSRIEPVVAYQIVDLNDGSRLTVAKHARLDVLETSSRLVSLALRHGRVRFDVRPHGPRAWRVDCGMLTVEVVGTGFTVERTSRTVSVRVMHGAVLVRGATVPDGVQRLNAGQTFEVASAPASAPATTQASQSALQEVPSAQGVAPKPAAPLSPTRPVRTKTATPSLQALPAQDDNALERLWEDADAARARGAPLDAVGPLEQLLAREDDVARRGLAAFTLARLRLGPLNQPQRAVADLELALLHGLREPLAEEARARLVEAHARSGDGAAACAAAHVYRARYPHGLQQARVDRFCSDTPAAP